MITAETRSVPTELSEGEQTTMFQAAFREETNFSAAGGIEYDRCQRQKKGV